MKRERKYKIFIICALAMCLVPLAGLPVFGGAKSGSNEILSAAPSLRTEDGSVNTSVLTDAADWFSDRFFLRQELITAGSRLSAGLLGTSAEDDVILGKNGWLYYAETLNDYTGAEELSDREIFSAARNLRLMSDYCRGQGMSFLFTVAPNKNSLYPENMPAYPRAGGQSNADRLAAALSDQGVPYLDLFSVFREQSQTLYFKRDTHWNSRGAALAADAIISATGGESNYFSDPFGTETEYTGDLYKMLYPASRGGDTNPVYGGALDYDFAGPATEPDSVLLRTQSAGEGSLYMFRDSFGNLLYPYLAASRGTATFSRAAAYNMAAAGASGAEDAVIELVERNICYLVQYVPVMPAPEADTPSAKSAGTASAAISPDGTLEGFALIKGRLNAETDPDSPVLLSCGGTSREAFLLEDGQFGAYIPADAPLDSMSIFYRLDGSWYQAPCDTAE
jgi:hypothetical protein